MYDPAMNPQDQITINQGGREFKLKRRDPFGFFYIETDFKLPEKYQGAYTKIAEAEKAINMYFEEEREFLVGMMEEMAAEEKPTRKKKAA